MEIERKWFVKGWPEDAVPDGITSLPVEDIQEMRQGYVSVEPTVRIREEKQLPDGRTEYILCFKSRGGIAREEIEFPVEEQHFRQLETLIALPLIPKIRKTYLLPDGSRLEVNHVDEGTTTAFWYAEIEYASVEEAQAWTPPCPWLASYLSEEVTGRPGCSMGAYWERTRGNI